MNRLAALALVSLAACTDPESAQDRFHSLESNVEITCGSWNDTTYGCAGSEESKAQEVLTCMTDALATGKRAVMSTSSFDSRMFRYVMYSFTVDGQVKVFQWYPGVSHTMYEPHVASEQTCAGGFRIVDSPCPFGTARIFRVVVENCAQPTSNPRT